MRFHKRLRHCPLQALAWFPPATIYQSDMSPHPAYTYIQLYISQNVYISHQIYVYLHCGTDIYHDMSVRYVARPCPCCMPHHHHLRCVKREM